MNSQNFQTICKLTVEIPNKAEKTVVASPFKWIPLKARFLWESDSRIYFNNALNSDHIRSKTSSENPDIDSIGSDLSSIFPEAAELSLRPKRSKNSVPNKCPKNQHKKWFDYDCRQSESNLNDSSRQKHKNPHNEYIRKAYQQLCNKNEMNSGTAKSQSYRITYKKRVFGIPVKTSMNASGKKQSLSKMVTHGSPTLRNSCLQQLTISDLPHPTVSLDPIRFSTPE